MPRLIRLVTLSVVPLVAAALALLAILAVPSAPDVAVAAVPNLTSPTPTPVPTPTLTCTGCVTPEDAICWESMKCPVPLKLSVPVAHPITIRYHTVAMSAQPMIDYVPVQNAIVTVPAGQTLAYVYVQLLPDPGMTQHRQFAVAFDTIVGGQLTRPQAIVTITGSSAGN